MKEVGGPVIAIAVILCAVFIPVAMSGGITGRLYQQFAITIAVSVAFSAINALTLSPALAAMLLKPASEKKGLLDRFFGAFNRGFDAFTRAYLGVAGFFARKVIAAVLVLIIIVGATVVLAKKVPGGFVPEEDEGYFMMGVILPDAASLERTASVSNKVAEILSKVDEVATYTLINGFNVMSGTSSTNAATVFVSLKHWNERTKTAAEIIQTMNAATVGVITEATVVAFGPPPIVGLGNGSGFTMMLQDRGGQSPQYLAEQAQRFIAAAKERPEIGNVYTLYRSNVPQKSIEVDQDKVEKLGVRLSEVNSTISTIMGGSFVNNFNRFGRQYRVYVQGDEGYRMTPDDLSQVFVRDGKGNMISLATLVTVKDTTGPLYTNHFNIYRAAEITGQPAPGFSSSQALDALEEVAKEVLPPTMGYQWSNVSYQERESAGKGASVFGMALLFVFLILAAQYESWKLPFSVLLGTPWAVMGALFGLFVGGMFAASYVNNVFAQIGLVMLIGLNAKNAILIVEFAKLEMETNGKSALEAAIEAARLRFRPILMTSFAFILGVVPLMLASGAGAEARKVMGTTVFSGMLVATIIGVILIPAFFVMIEGNKKKLAQSVKNPSNQSDSSHEAHH
jgi:HAE1 family hydrophobic/amphiphilic exporter-1